MPEKEFVKNAAELAVTGGIAALGGGCKYLYEVSKGAKFRLSLLVINLFIGGFVGITVDQFLDPELAYRGGIIAIAGISSYQIVGFIESGGWKYVANAILRAAKLPEIQ